jgi:uncharacterized protein YaaR (DUF327 family)
MAKIDFPEVHPAFFNPALYTGIKAETKKTKDRPSVPKTSFSQVLDQSREAELEPLKVLPVSEETVQKLLDAVHSAGDDLKKLPFPEEILRYKNAVRDFLHYVVENSFDTEKQFVGVSLLKRKEKTLVQVVDRKLEQLAAGILAGQTSQLELLARLEEIKGILVDITIKNGIKVHA